MRVGGFTDLIVRRPDAESEPVLDAAQRYVCNA